MSTSLIPHVNQGRSGAISTEHRTAIREVGKLDRRALTDAIADFINYVDQGGEGSTRPDLAFKNMTATIYAPFGLNTKQMTAKDAGQAARDTFDATQLTFCQAAERAAAELLVAGMARKDTRQAIKTEVRDTVRRIAAIFNGIQKKGAA